MLGTKHGQEEPQGWVEEARIENRRSCQAGTSIASWIRKTEIPDFVFRDAQVGSL